MPQKKLLDYTQLSKSSKVQYQNYYDKIVKSGKKISQIKRMNVAQWKKTFGSKGRLTIASLEAKKRVITQQIPRHINQVNSEYFTAKNIQNKGLKKAYIDESYRLFNVKESIPENIDDIDDKTVIITREGQYGLIKLTNLANNENYWIKYKNQKNLDNQIEKLKKKYVISTYTTKYVDVKMYKSFIEKGFVKQMDKILS